MNNLLVAVLLAVLPLSGQAEALFETRNKAGGKIVLTDEQCRDQTHKLAYSVMPGGDTLLGCWSADNSFIHIGWYDGSLRSYPYDGWYDVRRVKPTM